MDNLEIYNKYRTVPDEAVKLFDNGNFKGTDINTMWRIKCLTEQFGIIGFGWTIKVLRTWTEQGADNEIMAFAEIEMKVKMNGEWSEPFTATGGNLMTRFVKSKNYFKNNDEAFKMAITDAFSVACKYLGFGADIYWENDRTKYTDIKDDKPQPKQIPTESRNEPKMTYEQALGHICEANGKTIKEIYKDIALRQMIPELYKIVCVKTKQAFDIVNEYIKNNKK